MRPITKTRAQTTRVRLKPVSGYINLGELRGLVAAAEGLPDSSQVYAEDPTKAPSEPFESWHFRGMSVLDYSPIKEEAPDAQ